MAEVTLENQTPSISISIPLELLIRFLFLCSHRTRPPSEVFPCTVLSAKSLSVFGILYCDGEDQGRHQDNHNNHHDEDDENDPAPS
jgi:hypothetical protein